MNTAAKPTEKPGPSGTGEVIPAIPSRAAAAVGANSAVTQARWRLVPPAWWLNDPHDPNDVPDPNDASPSLAGAPFTAPSGGWRWPLTDIGDSTSPRSGQPADYPLWGVWSAWSPVVQTRVHVATVHGPDPDPHRIGLSGWTLEVEGRAMTETGGIWTAWQPTAATSPQCSDVSANSHTPEQPVS